MAKDKDTKREIKAIWEAVRADRRARSKLFGHEELAQSAERLAGYGAHMKAIADLLAQREAASAKPAAAKRERTRRSTKAEAPAQAEPDESDKEVLS